MRIAILAWLAALAAIRSPAQDQPPPQPDALTRVKALEQQSEQLQKQLDLDLGRTKALPKQEQEAAVAKLLPAFHETNRKIADELLAIAEAAPRDAAALAAIRVALASSLDGKQIGAVLRVLHEHVLGEPIVDVLPRLAGHGDKGIAVLLTAVLEHNPSARAKGIACFELAKRTRDERAREVLLERLSKQFADVQYHDETLGALAERELYALRHLEVGMQAPEIVGKDMDGVAFQLSDYRGQVVVLDFWGYW